MSLSGLVLGVINIAIVIAVLLLIGAIILWFMSWMGMSVPAQVQKGYIIVVALIGLYMLVALLLGIPSFRVLENQHGFRLAGIASPALAAYPAGAATDLQRLLMT